MEKWMEELIAAGIDADKVTNKAFSEVVNAIGVEAAVKLFVDFHGVPIYIGVAYRRDLALQYLQKLSLGKTEYDLAKILKFSKSEINKLMNKTTLFPVDRRIPMFPDLEPDYREPETNEGE
jgi:hypothetical protein